MDDRIATKRFYAMSNELRFEPWTATCYGATTMNRVADRVWSKYGVGPKPAVHCTRGDPAPGGGFTSYYDPQRNRVVLARHQRTLTVLLHELAHALTPHAKLAHGPAFCITYARLMGEFAGEDPDYLMLHMITAGLVSPRHLKGGWL